MEEREEAEDPEDRVALEERSGDGRGGGTGDGGREGGLPRHALRLVFTFTYPILLKPEHAPCYFVFQHMITGNGNVLLCPTYGPAPQS